MEEKNREGVGVGGGKRFQSSTVGMDADPPGKVM